MSGLHVRPREIRLEASSFCQLRCPSCPTTSRAIHPAVGGGFLELDEFRRLLDANPRIRAVELSNYGEIFLNPELSGIVKEAFRRGVRLTADNGVNLNRASEEVLEDLVRYRFHSMMCSIDGASQETYEKYRVRGDFDAVMRNVATLNELKRHQRTRRPRMMWQFVVFGHNEHEVPRAREMARRTGMGFRVKLSWDPDFSPIRDRERVRREVGLGAATREEFRARHGRAYLDEICHQLWDEPQINWDGKVLGCCRNFWGDFGGNAFEDGLEAGLNHEKMRYAKEMLLGSKPARPDIPCSTCDIYLERKATGRWVPRGAHARRAWRLRARLAHTFQDLSRWFRAARRRRSTPSPQEAP
ncbi:MAG TPA: radical SAM protein [Gemmatimonadota bacterium]|nr:radical SAM protein [Gemmatimonadota bacterium]